MKLLLLGVLILGPVLRSFACEVSEDELVNRLSLAKFSRKIRGKTFGISQSDFETLASLVSNRYAHEFKKNGYDFVVEAFWNSEDENAYSGIRENLKQKYVVINGAYARKKHMTRDAFLTVICHEVGHHLGGFPKKHFAPWASAEGQADYFSTLKCVKAILKDDPANRAIADSLKLPVEVRVKCQAQYSDSDGLWICLRSAQAALDYGRVIAEDQMRGMNDKVSLMTPSPDRRYVTDLYHPEAQCRLDTKLQGALCNVDEELSDSDEVPGTCNVQNGAILGVRPKCWFVPTR